MKNDLVNYLTLYKELYGDEIYLNQVEEDKISTSSSNELELNTYLDSIKNCMKCSLGKSRNKIVLGMGNPDADIVFVGEAPGKEEDIQGLPFVGRSGKLLDKMLDSINLSREKVYILNVLKCRPPDNRDPLASEIEMCEQYLKKQLEIINPKLVVSLGRISAMTLLKTKESLKNLREKKLSYEGIDFLATYHPAALLRNPNFKKYAWEDFKLIRDKYINGKTK